MALLQAMIKIIMRSKFFFLYNTFQMIFNTFFPVRYHLQQNKYYLQRCLPAHFEATLDLIVANLLAHNNLSQICYFGQISLQSAAVNCSFSGNLTPFGGNVYFAVDGTYTRKKLFACLLLLVILCKETVSNITASVLLH